MHRRVVQGLLARPTPSAGPWTAWARRCSCAACSRPLAEADTFRCPDCLALRAQPSTDSYHRLLGLCAQGATVRRHCAQGRC